MSGLEILGAVAASVQLTSLCVNAGARLRQVMLETNKDLPSEIVTDCDNVLSAIKEQFVQFAGNDDHAQAVHQLASRLHKVKHKVEKRRQSGYLFRAASLLVGYESEYREMMEAIERYIATGTLSLHVAVARTLAMQGEIPASIEAVCAELSQQMSRMTAMQEDLQKESDGSRGLLPAQQTLSFQSLRDDIVDEIRKLRGVSMESSHELTAILAVDRTPQMDRGELTLEYGTMADYLEHIWNNAAFTTDQDVWGCFIDVFEVYKDPKLSRSLRQIPVGGEFGNKLMGKYPLL